MSAFVLWQIVNTGTVLTVFVEADHKLLVFFFKLRKSLTIWKRKMTYLWTTEPIVHRVNTALILPAAHLDIVSTDFFVSFPWPGITKLSTT